MTSSVSVVIPYFNAEDTISRALNSIKSQTQAVMEVIIINDGGDFIALESKVNEFREHLNIILIDLVSNFGAAYARNVGVLNSSGHFVAFLDADDVWHPKKIAIQYAFMRDTVCFLSCHGYEFDINISPLLVNSMLRVRKLKKYNFLYGNQIFTPTVMIVRERFVQFDERLTRSEDLKCWLSNFKNGDFFHLNLRLAGGYKRAVGESGLSGSYVLMHREYLNAWRLLVDDRVVGGLYYLIAIIIEHIKYPIRLFSSYLRGLGKG